MAPPLLDNEDLKVLRRAYAAQVTANAGVRDAALQAAFAAVPREAFLPGPDWLLPLGPDGPRRLPDADPVYAYQDQVLAIDAARGINNGSPSLHAAMLAALEVRPGQRIAHIGAGTGYYSAILSELVGAQGHVLAVEFEAELAEMAGEMLKGRRNVTVRHGDGTTAPEETVDAVYVNFAVERPAPRWIEALADDGKLLFQLGVPQSTPWPGPVYGAGAAFLVRRRPAGFAARALMRTAFIFAQGDVPRDEAARDALAHAFRHGDMHRVRSLIWRRPIDPAGCWFAAEDWALSYDGVGEG